MLKRALFFSTPYCLSLRNGQMVIHTREAPEMQKSVPIEDIGFVVLEDQQTSVTLPLIKDSFLSGLVTTFVRSITAISAIILLVTPQYLLITTQINEFAEKGKYGVACAYATILIAIVYASIVVMNLVTKYFGTSRKIKGGSEDA